MPGAYLDAVKVDFWREPGREVIAAFNGTAARHLVCKHDTCESAAQDYELGLTVDDALEGIHVDDLSETMARELLVKEEGLGRLLRDVRNYCAHHLPAPRLSLFCFADPDDGLSLHLALYVSCAMGFDDLLDEFDRFYDGWWLDNAVRAEGLLVVMPSDATV